jgi:hypothetical protein
MLRVARVVYVSCGLVIAACGPAAVPAKPAAPSASTAAAAPGLSRGERRGLKLRAGEAYDRNEWKSCAVLFEHAGEFYGAACCLARNGEIDPAFAMLGRAIDGGYHDGGFERDPDLVSLHADPRWKPAVARVAAQVAAYRKTLNPELAQLYDDDQADRSGNIEQIDWTKVAPRDEARRKRVDEILTAGAAVVAEDYFHAAMVYQHGSSPDEIQRAHDLAIRAVELDPAHDQARWLAAASEDRKLMYTYKAQKWGTQYKKVDGKWIVWPVDPAVTDAERETWNVPPIADALAHAEQMNAQLKASAAK